MADNYQDILLWFVKYKTQTQMIELYESATLYSLKAALIPAFGLTENDLANLVVICKGRALKDETKSMIELVLYIYNRAHNRGLN